MDKRSLAEKDTLQYLAKGLDVVISDTTQKSIFSDDYRGLGKTIPQNTIKEGDLFSIRGRGKITTSVGASSTSKFYVGSQYVQIDRTYSNNRTNYYIDIWVIVTIKSVGANGTFEVNGRIFMQSDAAGSLVVQPVASTSDLSIDTTIDNVIDYIFKWNTAGQNLTVTSLLMEKV